MGFAEAQQRARPLPVPLSQKRDEDDTRAQFFHKMLDHTSDVIKEYQYVDKEYDGDSDEGVDDVIKDVCKKVKPLRLATNDWKLIAAGQQSTHKKRSPEPIREIKPVELKNEKGGDSEVDKEAWILVAKGDNNGHPMDELIDLDGRTWYPKAKGGDLYKDDHARIVMKRKIKKLAVLDAELQLGGRPWDSDNLPIKTGEFIHVGHHAGLFRKINRDSVSGHKLIKAKRTRYTTFWISNASNEVKDQSEYFKHVMEKACE